MRMHAKINIEVDWSAEIIKNYCVIFHKIFASAVPKFSFKQRTFKMIFSYVLFFCPATVILTSDAILWARSNVEIHRTGKVKYSSYHRHQIAVTFFKMWCCVRQKTHNLGHLIHIEINLFYSLFISKVVNNFIKMLCAINAKY